MILSVSFQRTSLALLIYSLVITNMEAMNAIVSFHCLDACRCERPIESAFSKHRNVKRTKQQSQEAVHLEDAKVKSDSTKSLSGIFGV